MGVEAAVLGVADAGADVGLQDLRGALHRLGEGVGGVFDVRGVLRHDAVDDVGATQRVQSGLRQIVHDGAASNGLGVHVLEYVEDLLTEGVVLHVRHESVGVQAADAGDRHAGSRHSLRQSRAEVYAHHGALAPGIHLLERQAKPPLQGDRRGLRRVPDVHRPEVRPVGHRVASAMDDRDLALVVQLLYRLHRRI